MSNQEVKTNNIKEVKEGLSNGSIKQVDFNSNGRVEKCYSEPQPASSKTIKSK